jgi:hypothetical protein
VIAEERTVEALLHSIVGLEHRSRAVAARRSRAPGHAPGLVPTRVASQSSALAAVPPARADVASDPASAVALVNAALAGVRGPVFIDVPVRAQASLTRSHSGAPRASVRSCGMALATPALVASTRVRGRRAGVR